MIRVQNIAKHHVGSADMVFQEVDKVNRLAGR